ncbi:MAG: ribonuclease P protein component [Parachlamydiaceae bacterium]|nr:ribonuclease P protein component [Parachlamydiaceae bacterium]
MARGSQRHIGRWIIIDVRQRTPSPAKLGITVTKKYGDAHVRNRFKRIVREAFRLSRSHFPDGLDILVKPRTMATEAMMQEIQQELIKLVEDYEKSRIT